MIGIPSAIIIAPNLIRINRINCYTQNGECEPEVKEKLSQFEGYYLGYARKEIKSRLLEDRLVRESSVRFTIPDQLSVHVVLRKPAYALKDTGTGTFSLIDSEGVVISTTSVTNLAYLEVNERPPSVSEQIGETIHFALDLLDNMNYVYQIKTGKLYSDKLVIELPNGIGVLFPLVGDKDILIGSLRVLYSRVLERPQDFAITRVNEIDLRFKNPVIR